MPDYLTVSNPLEGVDPRVFLESTLPIRPWPDPLIEALGRRDLDPWHDLLDRKVVWRAVDDGTEFETPT